MSSFSNLFSFDPPSLLFRSILLDGDLGRSPRPALHLLGRGRGRGRTGEAALASSAAVAALAPVEKVRDEVDGEGEDDGRVLLRRDRVERLKRGE